jgi:hypothetical protein
MSNPPPSNPEAVGGDTKDHKWGDYYFSHADTLPARVKNKWAFRLLQIVNDEIPRFTDIFDQDTFILCSFIFVVSTLVIAFFMSRIFKVRLQDRDL